jgi:uncharacterized OB-fold protein
VQIKPLPGFVLVEAETVVEVAQRELNKRLPGFEYAPPKFQGPPSVGTVRYIGEDVDNVVVGNRVVFKWDGKRGFELEGEKLMRVKAEDVLAVIEEDE